MLPLATLTSKNCGPLGRPSRPSSSQAFRLSGASSTSHLDCSIRPTSRVSSFKLLTFFPPAKSKLEPADKPSSHPSSPFSILPSLWLLRSSPKLGHSSTLSLPPASQPPQHPSRDISTIPEHSQAHPTPFGLLQLSSPPSAATCASTPLVSSPRHESRTQFTICLRHLKEACASHCIPITYLETSQSRSYQISFETVYLVGELMSR